MPVSHIDKGLHLHHLLLLGLVSKIRTFVVVGELLAR